MKVAVDSILSLLDAGTGFCYWLLGRDLLPVEVQRIQDLFIQVQKPDDEVDLLRQLHSLSPGKDLLLVCDNNNHNLVQWCILNKYTQALIVLLNYGCNPSRSGLSGIDLPLSLACCLGYIDIIQLLIEHGANPSQTTILSTLTLKYFAQKLSKEHYLKLIDLFKYRTNVTSLSIILTFDDLTSFRLLMGETLRSPSTSASSTSSIQMISTTIEDSRVKIADFDSDLFREQPVGDFDEEIHHEEENNEQQQEQQSTIANDNLSDYADHDHFFPFGNTLYTEPTLVQRDEGTQVLSDKGNQLDREEISAPGATTDGGYGTVDDSSIKIKLRSSIQPIHEQHQSKQLQESTQSLCTTMNEPANGQRYEIVVRTKSQQHLNRLSKSQPNMTHRHSLPVNIFENDFHHQTKRARSNSSFLLSNMSNATKQTAYLLRLLHQMIEREAANILDYFLKQHRDEFNEHFHTAASSSDIQLKTYELLANIKSDRIYNVLLSSNCAYFNTVTTSLCDRENNTLVHSLLGQDPLQYQPSEMTKMVERYMACGLKEFINRPNLSNHSMIQVLLCNEHFLKMIFFTRNVENAPVSSIQSNTKIDPMIGIAPLYDSEVVEKWRHSYLILTELLIKHGARIDIPCGSYPNSIDCLLSSLINLSKHFSSILTIFDMKYLKRLIFILLSSSNLSKNRSISFKYGTERLLQLVCHIHIIDEHLADIISLVHHLAQHEFQFLRLTPHTLTHLLKLWLIHPNFLCSSVISKGIFMQQLLATIVRRIALPALSFSESQILLAPGNSIPRRASISSLDTDIRPQHLLSLVLNLIPHAQTCIQINFIYELILILVDHCPIEIISNEISPLPLPIVYLCSQVKMTNNCLLIPFIDLFALIHSPKLINKSKEILTQISMKRLATDLYKYFLALDTHNRPIRSLRHLCTKRLYHHLQKPFVDSVTRLPIADALKQRILRLHDI